MRALHLVSSTDRRGAQVFASLLAERLGGPPDHELVAVEPGADGAPLDVEVLGRRRTDPAGLGRLVRRLRGADVLVAHGSSALLHGAAASALARRPFVYRNIGDPAAWGRVRLADVRIGAPLRRAAAVSAIYPAARAHLVEAYRLRPDRVVTIPNGVVDRTPVDAAGRRAAAHALALRDGLRWVGFLGALSPEKGILDAVGAVVADPALGLVVAGAGPEEQAARRAAAPAGDRIRFLGPVTDTAPVYAAVEAVVLPSRTEGIPAAAVEAGLSGLPVVAADVGGTSEVVLDGRTGVLVASTSSPDLAAALHRALRHAPEWGSAARLHCSRRFTIDRVAPQWSELLDRVVAG